MESITYENILKLKEKLSNHKIVLYGAGDSGKKILNILNDVGLSVDFFVDDNPSKQGTKICNISCISYEDLKAKSLTERICVIISSLYAKTIEKKLEKLSVDIYEIYSVLKETNTESLKMMMRMKQDKKVWHEKWIEVREIFSDDESKKIWNVIEEVERSREISNSYFIEISSNEEHYFVEAVKKRLNGRSVLVDCGAYTGDMLGQLINGKIEFSKIYMIEANPVVYEKMIKGIKELKLSEKVMPYQVGLYDKEGKMEFYLGENNMTAGYLTDRTGGGGGYEDKSVEVPIKTLDDIIKEKIDFLKMDIEGAELPALRGGEKIILKSRPILAISIYHSFDDLVDIPIYLNGLLENYSFFIRHHSFTLGETVLYGIPNER